MVFGHRLLVLSDAHVGATPPEVEEALLAFLERAPTLGDCLLLNGDIFDFWFAYRRVIPRRGFHVAAEIRRARKRMPVAMVGGNHDRWGEDFWERDLDVRFAPLRMERSWPLARPIACAKNCFCLTVGGKGRTSA